jgi:hypothetical protein
MKLLILTLFLINYLLFFGQESHAFSSGIRLNRLDFFQENSLAIKKEKLNHEFGLGFGINKTIFQKRLNPELFYGISSNFKQESKFNFQLLGSYHINFYNVNRNNTEIHYFNEILAGFNLSFGKKNKIYFIPQMGLISESFKSDYLKKFTTHLHYSYSAKIGFSHAF